MQFMVIERFAGDDIIPVYRRLRDAGRGLPDGLTLVDSWVEAGFGRCFQVMDCADPQLLQQWVMHWRGLGVSFEIIPVVSGKDTAAAVAALLDRDGG